MEKISKNQITWIKDAEFKTRMMIDSVKLCYKKGLFIPTLTLICSYIDGMGNGTKKDYLDNLKTEFPDLCKELGASVFYQKYRNGIIHELCPKSNFALDRGSDMNNQYVREVEIEDDKRILITLNIDRLTNDFLKWVNTKRNSARNNT